jgi:hypothetical protein
MARPSAAATTAVVTHPGRLHHAPASYSSLIAGARRRVDGRRGHRRRLRPDGLRAPPPHRVLDVVSQYLDLARWRLPPRRLRVTFYDTRPTKRRHPEWYRDDLAALCSCWLSAGSIASSRRGSRSRAWLKPTDGSSAPSSRRPSSDAFAGGSSTVECDRSSRWVATFSGRRPRSPRRVSYGGASPRRRGRWPRPLPRRTRRPRTSRCRAAGRCRGRR